MEGSLIPGATLRLSTSDKEKLGRMLAEMTEDLEQQHRPYIDNIDTFWKFYWATPLQQERNTPWPKSSNIVYPLIQLHSDAIKARYKNTLFATHPDLVLGRSRNEQARELSQKRADFFNWASDDNEFDILSPVGQWVDEAVPIGSSILWLKYVDRFRHMFLPSATKLAAPTKVNLGSGPVIEWCPREQTLWTLNKPIQDAELVVRQYLKSGADLVLMRQAGSIEMDQEEFEELLRYTSDGGYTATVRNSYLSQDGLTYINKEDLYDIREAWVDVPILKSGRLTDSPDAPTLPILVWFERNSGAILKVQAKPYLTRGVPAYEMHFRNAGNRRNPGGVAARLEHLQRGITTMSNQAIDAVTLSNSLNLITNDTRLQNQRFSPGKWPYTENLDSFKQIQLPKLITPDIALIQLMLATAERITGISDPLFGRETRHGGHPSPAASTAMLLQESREMFRDSLRGIRLQFNRLAGDVMLLYRQFGPPDPDRLAAALGDEDAADIIASLQPDAPPYQEEAFDLRVASETMNQDQEFQQALTLLQGQMSYASQVVNLTAAMEKVGAQAPIVAQVIAKSIETLTLSWTRVLEAGREDELNRFLIPIREGSLEGVQQLGQYATQQLQQGAAAQQGMGPMAGVPGQQALPIVPESPITTQMEAGQ